MNQDRLASALYLALNSDSESYDDMFSIFAEIQDVSEKLDNLLLNVLVDTFLSENIEFSVCDTAFELVRQYCSVEPVEVFGCLVLKEHSDFLFDEIIISDMFKYRIDVWKVNERYSDSPNFQIYQEIIAKLANNRDNRLV